MRSGQHQQTTSVKAPRPKKTQSGTYLAALERSNRVSVIKSVIILKAVRKQLLKATSNFSYYALLYQLLFKGLSQDQERAHLNQEQAL